MSVDFPVQDAQVSIPCITSLACQVATIILALISVFGPRRRIGGAMTADNVSVGDNASIPDTLGSPRSNISIPVETLVDLLDGWGAR